ncbi:MAG: 2Fe-2S iron-sulfur cluster-binding protein [Deltaproteobacteria bacterium]|nr:2Fe-2S iron-sulfur cluster-binding protein [Deltaproteobacteria bacterium]
MATFKLDGKEIAFEQGDTIIKAAWRQGVEIPHYCWHPGLSVAANCRMCLVELVPGANQRAMMLDVLVWDESKKDYVVSRKPKLQPSCQISAAEGMEVKSESSEHVALARKSVQEFLLLNHPVDCPICDQSGECKLQDYYMTEQATSKRMRDEPNHKPKGVSFGPTIVYDAERCIACTRCIRVCEEVIQDPMLDMRERGNLFEIITSPGRQVDGHYTMMLEWVCPVGALTTSHWRHKGRVWLLRGTQSVCPGCATGCAMFVDVDPRENTAFRNRPRENDQVNQFWMCDDGMLSYERVYKDRILSATIASERAKSADAIRHASALLSKHKGRLAVVLSAQRSTEENLIAATMAKALGADLYVTGKAAWDGDKILRNSDQNPNRAGALKAADAESLPGVDALLKKASSYDCLLVLGEDADVAPEAIKALAGKEIVVLATHWQGAWTAVANTVLPITVWAETDGTFVNAKGVAQVFKRALTPTGDVLVGWEALTKLAKGAGADTGFQRMVDLRAALQSRGLEALVAKKLDGVHPSTGAPVSTV